MKKRNRRILKANTPQKQIKQLISPFGYSIAGIANGTGLTSEQIQDVRKNGTNDKKIKREIEDLHQIAKESYLDRRAEVKAKKTKTLNDYQKSQSMARRAKIRMRFESLRLLLSRMKEQREEARRAKRLVTAKASQI